MKLMYENPVVSVLRVSEDDILRTSLNLFGINNQERTIIEVEW